MPGRDPSRCGYAAVAHGSQPPQRERTAIAAIAQADQGSGRLQVERLPCPSGATSKEKWLKMHRHWLLLG